MDVLKTATEWAKGEVFSSKFFIFFGVMFLAASIGCWQLGKTEVAKAFVWPTLVASVLLLIIGIGLVTMYHSKIKQFPQDHQQDATAFIQSEMAYAKKTLGDYSTIVFKVIPIMMAVASLFIMITTQPIWRAISITAVAMLTVVIAIDGTAKTRLENYHEQMSKASTQLGK